jgi:integrase
MMADIGRDGCRIFRGPNRGHSRTEMPEKGEGTTTMVTQRKTDRVKEPGRYRDGGVKGLYLKVTDTGAKSWMLRYERHGKEHFMGLGSASEFKLKEARERARAARQLLADGIDPLADRQAKQAAAKLAEARKITFRQASQRYFDQNEKRWTNATHRDAFLTTLNTYAFPVLGDMDVSAISVADVLRCLEPQWNDRAVTLDRVRGRIENVLDSCKARSERVGDNPASWDVIGKVLSAPRKVAPIQHHAAVPYKQINQFMADLRRIDSVAARALEFLILTAVRSSEVTGATWGEFDLDAVRIDFKTKKSVPDPAWSIPAHRMKTRRPHRVPLSPAAVGLLRKLPREAGSGNTRVFIGHRSGTLSKMSMIYVMQALGQKNVSTIHGFRSCFRDWAGETTPFAHDICEAALAHVRGDQSVVAYARGDLFDKRRALMHSWAEYCATPPAKIGGDRRATS